MGVHKTRLPIRSSGLGWIAARHAIMHGLLLWVWCRNVPRQEVAARQLHCGSANASPPNLGKVASSSPATVSLAIDATVLPPAAGPGIGASTVHLRLGDVESRPLPVSGGPPRTLVGDRRSNRSGRSSIEMSVTPDAGQYPLLRPRRVNGCGSVMCKGRSIHQRHDCPYRPSKC